MFIPSETCTKILESRYLYGEEKTYEDLVDRMLTVLPEGQEKRKAILREGFLGKLIIPATPNLTNLGTKDPTKNNRSRGLSISCFISEYSDDILDIIDTVSHNSILSSLGGGVGTGMSDIREIGSPISNNGKTGGIFPFLNLQASSSEGISQGGTRGGAAVVSLDIDHPEIEEFINFRIIEDGSDKNRKFPKLNHTVNLSDKFMNAVIQNQPFDLISRYDGSVTKTVNAFDLFLDLLEVRFRRGEPNIVFSDTVARNRSDVYETANIVAKYSNLCLEILLNTGKDLTAVCCLGSFNLVHWDTIKDRPDLVEAFMYFLHCSLEETKKQINLIENEGTRLNLQRVVNFIEHDHSIGLGVLGYHTYLQAKNLPLESALAIGATDRIFKRLREMVDAGNISLAEEFGSCPLAEEHGIKARFSNCLAIAPTAGVSHILDSVSPGIDPILSNYHSIVNENGTSSWRNPNLSNVINTYATNNNLEEEWVEEQWLTILKHEGSVQKLDWLDEYQKVVFKTAYEIDSDWIVDLAAVRQKYLDQSQSTNLFFPKEVHVRKLFNVHVAAWSKGLKTLYYCRSEAVSRANDTNKGTEVSSALSEENLDYQECLACQ